MVNENNDLKKDLNEINVEKQETLSDDLSSKEKSLEELLSINKINLTQQALSNVVDNVKTIKQYKSNSAAREYLKHLIVNDQDITEFIKDNKSTLQSNYNNNLLKKLEQLSLAQQESYDSIVSSFLERDAFSKNISFKENFLLSWYKFTNKYNSHELLYDKISQRNIMEAFQESKNGLKKQLFDSEQRKENHIISIQENQKKLESLTETLKVMDSEIDFAKMRIPSIESEKQILENDRLKQNNQEYETLSRINKSIANLEHDIEYIQEGAVESLAKAKHIMTRINDVRISIYNNQQLKGFYKEISQIYKRRVENVSDLMLDLDRGLSFTEAHNQMKEFIAIDKEFIKFDAIKTQQYKENLYDSLAIEPITISEDIPFVNVAKKKINYKLKISEESSQIKDFLLKMDRSPVIING